VAFILDFKAENLYNIQKQAISIERHTNTKRHVHYSGVETVVKVVM